MSKILQLIDKIERMYESPRFHQPISFSKDELRSNYGILLHGKDKNLLKEVYEGAELYNFKSLYFVLDHNRKEVTYYMISKEKIVMKHRTMFQELVWRNKGIDGLKGIVQEVMFTNLLPKFGIISSDKFQTASGSTLWGSFVLRSLAKGFYPYYIDLVQGREFIPISSEEELNKLLPQVWGDKKINEARLLLVSEKTL